MSGFRVEDIPKFEAVKEQNSRLRGMYYNFVDTAEGEEIERAEAILGLLRDQSKSLRITELEDVTRKGEFYSSLFSYKKENSLDDRSFCSSCSDRVLEVLSEASKIPPVVRSR